MEIDQKNLYIQILEVLANHAGTYMDKEQIFDECTRKGIVTREQVDAMFDREKQLFLKNSILQSRPEYSLSVVFRHVFDTWCIHHDYGTNNESERRYMLKIDRNFDFLQYVSLEHAVRTAEESKKRSNFAIGISLAALVVSAVIGIIQLRTPVDLSEDSIRALRAPQEPASVKELHEAPPPVEPAVVYERVVGQSKNVTRSSVDSAIAVP